MSGGERILNRHLGTITEEGHPDLYRKRESFMRSEIMGHCWANFSVIYGMTFGQEESSVLICIDAVIWSLVN